MSTCDDSVPLFQRLQQANHDELLASSSVESSAKRKRMKARFSSKSSDADDHIDSFKHKHAPTEMPSNRPVKRLRDNVNNSTRKFRDPRFMELNGKLNHEKFLQAYHFLEDYQQDEMKDLIQQMNKSKSETSKNDIKEKISKLNQEISERNRNKKNTNKFHELHQQEKEKVKQGKQPFFLKKSARKEIVLEEKYKELKDSGKLKKFLSKRRKKNANKDHRLLPLRRDTS
mmetsp:Transcript_18270/g.18345  ORF Transcript_18270/g.18345 Transcript_18270/m.18345 type:complete len:229 (+) Transcript_18270:59-745(+)